MGPWSKPTNVRTPPAGSSSTATLGPAEWALIVSLAALVLLGAAAVWFSRYEIGVAAGVPARLDRFTGQVIGCIPGQGCLELVPAGEPPLRSGVVHRIPGGVAPSAEGNATAAPPAAQGPAPQAAKSGPAAPAKP
ncbi:MAG TPA: hypothetical protein VJS38_05150 [Phenylobacterium sp.]|uniref:hypothetical protein n=1 Tax=Phenylobacterium sp. TaxID=1871053 RepID=UPI002B4776F8|nr:hypothetical protein [Phenylobacterium sp.]HKR87541.1 hypothetical protein [Phenylobacterium sp.]